MSDPAPGINFRKIVENAVSTAVVSVFMGACVIVWRGATSVDARVAATEKSLTSLIDNLSGKLTTYELQLTAQSNQLDQVSAQLKVLESAAASRHAAWTNREPSDWMKRAVQTDIQQQLLKK